MKENKTTRIAVTVIVAVAIAVASFFGGFLTSRLTRKSEVASYEWAIKTVQQYYYEDIPTQDILNGSLKGFAALCLDRYSAYYTAEEYAELLNTGSGNMSGVGVAYMYLSEGVHPQGKSGALVELVVGNSPAYYGGLQAGEFMTAVYDSEKRVEITSADAFSDFVDGKDTGEKFTIVTDLGEHEVSKEAYRATYCTMATNSARWNVTYSGNQMQIVESEGGISYLPDGAAYLKLDQFYGDAADEMAALIEKYNAENCTSLILDLRGNGGGYVDVMCDMSDIYTGQLQNRNRIAMQAIYKDGSRETFTVNDKYSAKSELAAGTKISVLADNGTASASEALIGVLIDNRVISYGDIYLSDFSDVYLTVTGTAEKNCRSYGKGIMQTTFVHPFTHEALKLTTARIYWPKGETCIHDVGLTTAVGCKTVKTEWSVTYGDTQLEKAVAAIYGN